MKKSIPMIFQGENAECGLAALAMILHFYGYAVELSVLRNAHNITLSGMSLASLLSLARIYHLNGRVIRLESDEMSKLKLPAILHWDLNHFVVLKEIRRDKYIIHDPGRGVVSLSQSMLAESFSGIAIELYPTATFQQLSYKKPASWLMLLRSVSGLRQLFVKICIYTILCQVLLLLIPRYFSSVIDRAIPASDMRMLYVLLLFYVGLRTLASVARYLKMICYLKFDSEVNLFIGSNMLRSLMMLPFSYFNTRQLGDVLYRFNNIEQIRQLITNGLVDGAWGIVVAVVALIVMAFCSHALTLISFLSAALLILFKLMISKRQQMAAAQTLTARSQEQAALMENIRCIQPIKVFSREADRISLWLNRYIAFLNASNRSIWLKNMSDNLKEYLSGCEYILLIYFGGIQVIHHQLSLGGLYMYLFYRQQFSDALNISSDKWYDLKLLSIHRERLQDILLQEREPLSLNKMTVPCRFSLRAAGLAFKFDSHSAPVFENLSFEIDEGECVVFVGPSGKGKSTLIKVLMGLLPATSGSIYIGDLLINDSAVLSQYAASVLQDDCLLNGTITQNITFFSTAPDEIKVERVARLAGIEDEIQKLPMQYDTLVGDLGGLLSGGQKQRILLARALYAEPKILFLDEATSHLDIDMEKKVNQAIKSLGVTVIMAAHRPETIRMADRVICLSSLSL